MYNMTNTFQFIVISASAERKNILERQFVALNEPVNVHYLEAATPANSTEYFKNIPIKTFEHISKNTDLNIFYARKCCFLSHIRALVYASETKSKFKYSIILEDDVAFLKENFILLINTILNNWGEYNPHKMISIGYIPLANYNTFLSKHTDYTPLLKTHTHTTVVYNTMRSGAQGYIVKNDDIPYLNYLNQPTFIELYKSLNCEQFINILKNNNVTYNNNLVLFTPFTVIDAFLNLLYKQMIVHPPLLIERIMPSLLYNNNAVYWEDYFKNAEQERDKYNLNI